MDFQQPTQWSDHWASDEILRQAVAIVAERLLRDWLAAALFS